MNTYNRRVKARDRIRELEQQNADLLAALKAAVVVMLECDPGWPIVEPAYEKAMQAIAKAEGDNNG